MSLIESSRYGPSEYRNRVECENSLIPTYNGVHKFSDSNANCFTYINQSQFTELKSVGQFDQPNFFPLKENRLIHFAFFSLSIQAPPYSQSDPSAGGERRQYGIRDRTCGFQFGKCNRWVFLFRFFLFISLLWNSSVMSTPVTLLKLPKKFR